MTPDPIAPYPARHISEPASTQHPAELIEPEEEGYLLHRQAVRLIDRAITHILSAPDQEIAAWQIAYALGSPMCMGLPMTAKAQEIGTSLANLSKGATAFCRANDLPPSRYMLSEKSRDSYRELRNKQERTRKRNEANL